MALVQPAGYPRLSNELEYYRKRCSELESLVESMQDRITELERESQSLKEQLQSMKATVSAVVARSIGTKPVTRRKRHKKPGRKKGHIGKSRKRLEHVDARVTIDQETCCICGKSTLSKRPIPYTRVVTDIVPAKPVVTEYAVNRRYCSTCKKQVSTPVPGVLPKEVFGLRLMLLMVSPKLLGMPYEKISDHLQLLFNLRISDAAIKHAVAKVAEAFGPRYNELIDDLQKEKNVHGDETSWRINGKNHWLWAFVGRWTVVYEVDQSRGKRVPEMVLSGYAGTVTIDSWPAWNHVGGSHQKCLVHYLREIDDTLRYKNPAKEFYAFGKRLRRILRDAIRSDKKYRKVKDRLRAKARLEKRIGALISGHYRERNYLRLVKRLKREKGMLFTFLEKKECDWNNNVAEMAIRPSVVVRKVTYVNKSLDGAKAHAVLMSIRETCKLRG